MFILFHNQLTTLLDDWKSAAGGDSDEDKEDERKANWDDVEGGMISN